MRCCIAQSLSVLRLTESLSWGVGYSIARHELWGLNILEGEFGFWKADNQGTDFILACLEKLRAVAPFLPEYFRSGASEEAGVWSNRNSLMSVSSKDSVIDVSATLLRRLELVDAGRLYPELMQWLRRLETS